VVSYIIVVLSSVCVKHSREHVSETALHSACLWMQVS
jgi:hypothetical protein